MLIIKLMIRRTDTKTISHKKGILSKIYVSNLCTIGIEFKRLNRNLFVQFFVENFQADKIHSLFYSLLASLVLSHINVRAMVEAIGVINATPAHIISTIKITFLWKIVAIMSTTHLTVYVRCNNM